MSLVELHEAIEQLSGVRPSNADIKRIVGTWTSEKALLKIARDNLSCPKHTALNSTGNAKTRLLSKQRPREISQQCSRAWNQERQHLGMISDSLSSPNGQRRRSTDLSRAVWRRSRALARVVVHLATGRIRPRRTTVHLAWPVRARGMNCAQQRRAPVLLGTFPVAARSPCAPHAPVPRPHPAPRGLSPRADRLE